MSSAGIDPEPGFTGNEFGTDSTSKAAKQAAREEIAELTAEWEKKNGPVVTLPLTSAYSSEKRTVKALGDKMTIKGNLAHCKLDGFRLRVFNIIKANDHTTTEDIIKVTMTSRTKVKKAISWLRMKGYIVVIKEGVYEPAG